MQSDRRPEERYREAPASIPAPDGGGCHNFLMTVANFNWYPERGSNPYSRRKQILSLLRLPIPPPGRLSGG